MAKQVLNYYQRNKSRIKAKRRQQTLSTTGGVRFTDLTKRHRPDHCELCLDRYEAGWKLIRLDYHHWIALRPDLGLWLCRRCHTIAGQLDKPDIMRLGSLYYKIKKEAEANA